MRQLSRGLALMAAALIAYLAFWPVSVEPVGWVAPKDQMYTGRFAANDRLAGMAFIDLDGRSGPEDAAIGPDGLIYATTHEGDIVRIENDGSITSFAQTGGRPLGIEFGADGALYVADAYRGLLVVNRAGVVAVLTNTAE